MFFIKVNDKKGQLTCVWNHDLAKQAGTNSCHFGDEINVEVDFRVWWETEEAHKMYDHGVLLYYTATNMKKLKNMAQSKTLPAITCQI